MTTPLEADPELAYPPQGWERNCKLTNWFIAQDPYPVVLTPAAPARTATGGYTATALPPRPEQIVRVILQTGAAKDAVDGIYRSEDGQTRRYDIVIVGKWNATIHQGDTWTDADGATWRVDGVQPFNGYEVKAGCTLIGPETAIVK